MVMMRVKIIDHQNPIFLRDYNKKAQAKGPQGLEGLISYPIRHWRAFFILFHHFDTLKYDLF